VNSHEIIDLQQQVQQNCDISDARYGGVYSLCGFLLRLRDLYKWENHLPPWQEPEPADLLDWIDKREQRWEKLTECEFSRLTIGAETFDPFDSAAINRRLRPFGLIYGAGYGAAMKPSFFLARLIGSRHAGELQIDLVDRELARDLFMAPAMRQGPQIYARRSAMLFSIWDQIMEMRPSARDALHFALAQHNLDGRRLRSHPNELGPQLQRVAELELDTWIHHEIGEAREEVFEGYEWQEIVSSYPDSPIELFARMIKDILADSHAEGLLQHIVANRKSSSLGFYVVFMRPFTRLLAPEVLEAFQEFHQDGDWSMVEQARRKVYARTQSKAMVLINLHREGKQRGNEWAKARILAELIEPLGFLEALADDQDESAAE